jgi:fermentation-respiration switch protein FrsA (DUF1100 family)
MYNYMFIFRSFIVYIGFIAFCLVGFTGCLRLDSNLFNPNETTIEEYKLENYTGRRECAEMGSQYNIPDSLIHLTSISVGNNNEKIYAVYIGDLDSIAFDTVFLYCHGNAEHMDLYWNRAKLLANVGGKNRFGVLYMDYRGYGLSEGSPSESNLYEDVDACAQWLFNRGMRNERIIYYGFSLGSAAATELTANPRTFNPSKLILESPFASAEVMVQDASRLALPASFFVGLKIDNAEEIKKVQQPFMWIHGENDAFLSISTHGEVVSNAYQGSKQIKLRVANGEHSNVPTIYGFDNYTNAILSFITQ